MLLQRAGAIAAVILAAIVLSGCFVIAKNLPQSSSRNVADARLLGAWQAMDTDDKEPSDAFLHFMRQDDPNAPLRLVWVESDKYQLYDVFTMTISGRQVFAAKLLTPMEKGDEMPDGYFIGFYDFKGKDIVFSLLDSEKVGELIAKGRLKGTRPPGKYEMATLTGSPSELAAFLASPDAQGARGDLSAMRRLTAPRQ